MHKDFDPVTLRLFVAACEERNIARAAAREAIVASAVSKRIAALEAEVGTVLLVRARRGIEPTPAGQALLGHARTVLATMARMHAELSEFASGAQGNVRVVASPSVLAEQLPADISRFLAQHPRLRVNLDERVSPDLVRAVREGAAELGVLWDAADLSGLQCTAYHQDHLCVAVPHAHRLAQRKRVRFLDVLNDLSVGITPGGLMDALLQRQAALAGRRMVYRITVSTLDAGWRVVAAGLGATVLPREAALSRPAGPALALVPLAEPWAVRRFVIVTRRDTPQDAGTRLLVDHLHAQARAGHTTSTAAAGERGAVQAKAARERR